MHFMSLQKYFPSMELLLTVFKQEVIRHEFLASYNTRIECLLGFIAINCILEK
jgi:hypothetical protein